MNERIKELLNDSGISVYAGDEVSVTQEDFQRFAELIIQECINQCLYSADSYRIEQHFGVK